MGSMWKALREESTPVFRIVPNTVADIAETDPSYFVGKDENGKIIAEGELSRFKLKLPDEYLNAQIKGFAHDDVTMITTIQF